MGNDRVQSFGRRRQEEPAEPMLLPPIQLPPVRLVLEVDRDALMTLGSQIQETVYNATTAGLLGAIEDFANRNPDNDEDDEDDDDPAGPGVESGDTFTPDELRAVDERQRGDGPADSR